MADDPVPVKVVAPSPLAVTIQDGGRDAPGERRMPRQDQAIDPSLAATTTYQQDLTMAGQRAINVVWESTQAKIALYVVVGAMAINGFVVVLSLVMGRDMSAAQALALGFVNTIASSVISFYFSRTNHAAIGGVGPKAQQPYDGR